mgnify:CR=1 FL=1
MYTAGPVGNYSVEVTSNEGCIGTGSFYFNPQGLQEPSVPMLSLWPNPAGSQLYFSRSTPEPVDLRMFDATGRLVLEQTVKATTGDIDVSFLQPGIYLVEVGKRRVVVVKQ